MSPIYELSPKDANGEPYPLSGLQGDVVLIVNVASKCGYTPQYTELEQLYQKYSARGFQVLGFPCNQFGHQEPGSDAQIQQFCSRTYGVSFPVLGKCIVNGPRRDPVFAFLEEARTGSLGLHGVQWNFEKFLLNRNGEVVQRYSTFVNPSDIAQDIEKLL
ncbi:hypothetical protein DAKH74_043350 [Maudiozyma humilis]|uniref:Glutathione peroxidase n=1 Tax=Maudiozyma humilis TaxID=51915 RepID=A0AAV5S1I3_MAUHU|nr:hypothetical protein DAKH74_043350 [Kazachstania humilis]